MNVDRSVCRRLLAGSVVLLAPAAWSSSPAAPTADPIDACAALVSAETEAEVQALKSPGPGESLEEVEKVLELQRRLRDVLSTLRVSDRILVVDLRLCEEGTVHEEEPHGCSGWFNLINSGLEGHLAGDDMKLVKELHSIDHFSGHEFKSLGGGVALREPGPIVQVNCWSVWR